MIRRRGLQSVHPPLRDMDAIHVRRNRTWHAISEHESKLNNLEDCNIARDCRPNVEELRIDMKIYKIIYKYVTFKKINYLY